MKQDRLEALSNEKLRRRADRSIAVRLLLCFFLFYAGFAPGNFKSTDEWTVFEATASLWKEGRPTVLPAPYTYRGPDGHLYSQYGLGQSVLALPFFGVGRIAAHILPYSWRVAIAGPKAPLRGPARASGTPEITAVTLFAPTTIAALLAICFLLQRRIGVSPVNAVWVSVLMGTTSYIAMHSTYFLRHGTTTLLLMGALLAFQHYRSSKNVGSLFVGGLLASLIPLVRLPDAILGLPLSLFVISMLWESFRLEGIGALRRAVPALAAPLLAALLLYALSNWMRWGTWFESPIMAYSTAFGFPLLKGIRGFLLSPGASIFLYSPLLLLVPWSAPALARRDRALSAFCLGTSLWLLLFYSKWDYWPGLPTAPGPRYLFATVPLLLISLGPWLDESRSNARWRALFAFAFGGAVVQAGLLLAHWRWVLHVLDVAYAPPPFDWVFDPEKSPILAAYRVIAMGELNPWLWRLAQGWRGFDPQPEIAVALAFLWLVAVVLSVRGLVRVTRARVND